MKIVWEGDNKISYLKLEGLGVSHCLATVYQEEWKEGKPYVAYLHVFNDINNRIASAKSPTTAINEAEKAVCKQLKVAIKRLEERMEIGGSKGGTKNGSPAPKDNGRNTQRTKPGRRQAARR